MTGTLKVTKTEANIAGREIDVERPVKIDLECTDAARRVIEELDGWYNHKDGFENILSPERKPGDAFPRKPAETHISTFSDDYVELISADAQRSGEALPEIQQFTITTKDTQSLDTVFKALEGAGLQIEGARAARASAQKIEGLMKELLAVGKAAAHEVA